MDIKTPEGWKPLQQPENPLPPPEQLSVLSVRIRLEAAMEKLAPEITQGKDCYLWKERIRVLDSNEILRARLMPGDVHDHAEVNEDQPESEPLAILSAMYDANTGGVTVQVIESDGTANTNEIIERFKEKVTQWVEENNTETFRKKFGPKE